MLPIATLPASPEELLVLARAQSLPSKVMLEYLSLALLPTPEPQLLSAYAICCTRVNAYPLGESPEAVLAGLLGLGLAVRGGEGITCLIGIREDVAADAVRAGRGMALAGFCKERKIERRGHGPTAVQRLHKVRLALYSVLDQGDPLVDLAGTFQAHPGILPLIGKGFLDPGSLDALPRNVAFYVAAETIQTSIYQADDAPVVRRWLDGMAQRVQPANELLHGLLQMTQLLRGDLPVQHSLVESGTGLMRILAAAACGAEVSGAGEVELQEQPWIFQRVILAGCRSSLGQSARVRELAIPLAGQSASFETSLVRLLWQATEFPEMDVNRLFLELHWSPEWPHGCHLATAMVCSWLALKDELLRMEEHLLSAQEAYQRSGYRLLAEMAREALRRAHDEEPQSFPLLDLVRPQSQWERHLDELSRWVTRRNELRNGGALVEGDERLIWSVERRGSTLQVEPKIQKVKRNGEWSSGRAQRLLSTAHNPPEYAQAQDRRALRAAVAANATFAWGRESEDEAALLELVGHPRVLFEEKGIARPVSVVRGQPRLRIKRKGQELHLRIEPEPGKRARVKVVPEADRLTLYSLTREQEEFSRLLGPGWLVVPEEREAAIREIAAAAAGLEIVLDSDLRLGGEEVTMPADPTLRLRLAPEGRGLSGRLLVRPFGVWGPFFEPGKGGEALTAERDGVAHHAVRDLKAEKLSVKSAKAVLPQLGLTFSLETPLQSLEFLEALQEHLANGFLAVEWPEGEAFQLAGSKTLSQLALSVAPERDWFSLDGTLTIDDNEVLSLQQLLQLAQESEGRFLTLANGKYLALTQEFRARLDQLALLTEKGTKGRLKAHPLVATMAFPDLLPDGSWSQKRQLLEQAQQLKPKLPKGLTAELRTYQKEGFTWMARLAHWQAGACLADDMGLGKTVQALAMLLQRSHLGPALVIAPTSVCANWTEESQRFAPGLRFRTLGEGDRAVALSDLGPGDVVLCSYGLLVNEADRLLPVRWSTAVLDEAQYIKNSTTLRFKAAASLLADFRLATTGTPIENHLEELWSLFAFLNPGLLGTRSSFVSRFARPIAAGDTQAKETLRRLVHPFILRRGKGEVLRELPAKTEITYTVELHPKEMALYESLRRDAVESVARSGGTLFTVLTSLTKLRRACCHPRLVYPGSMLPGSKLEAFSELVDELRSGGHRALVFSQFVDHLAIVSAHLDTRGIAYRYLDGSTPAKKRREEVNAFQGGQGELFLISLKAGGVGLNLTAADYVIHLDPWWNPAVEDQASDRAHRMGQTRPVTVYRLVAAKTIEQKIVALHTHKRDLAEKLLEGTDKATKLDVNELMALMTQG